MKKANNIFTRIRLYSLAGLLSVAASTTTAGSELCPNAANPDNYNTEFLKNFITLKQGNDGWLFRDIGLKKKFGPNRIGIEKLNKLNKLLKGRGTKLILVPTPTRAITHPEKLGAIDYDVTAARRAYKKFIKQLNHRSIATPKLYRLTEHPHPQPLFFARDHHWTSQGAEAVAKLTADIIIASGKSQAIEKIRFTTNLIGRTSNNGSLKKAAEILCGSHYQEENFRNYFTERNSLDNSETDLFSDTPVPQVVLVGTSNSKGALNFNFSGFLRQYADIDILNKAESGSGQDQALQNYLTSREFADNPPRILIWELPGYYSLNNQTAIDALLQHLENLQKNSKRRSS